MQNLIPAGNTVTMSSREIADLTEKRHDNVMRTIETLYERGAIGLPQFEEVPNPGAGPLLLKQYRVGKRDSYVIVAQLSPEFTAALVDRWQELESKSGLQLPDFSNPAAAARAWADQVESNQTLQLENRQQAVRIGALENLFKEGMTVPQFCKGLNGVNVMQVANYLEGRNWLFNESKSGIRWRVAAYARDKYLTEHQVEVTPHGKEPFISFTPVLLQKGAARLHELYLAGDLPMKKSWDGLFTHDKAFKGVA